MLRQPFVTLGCVGAHGRLHHGAGSPPAAREATFVCLFGPPTVRCASTACWVNDRGLPDDLGAPWNQRIRATAKHAPKGAETALYRPRYIEVTPEKTRDRPSSPRTIWRLGTYEVRNYVIVPQYPGGYRTLMREKQDALTSCHPQHGIQGWYILHRDHDYKPSWKKVKAKDFHADESGENSASMDHIYERAWLQNFFGKIIDETEIPTRYSWLQAEGLRKINPEDFRNWMGDDSRRLGRLQKVFNTFPSRTRYLNGLMGTNEGLNSIKATASNYIVMKQMQRRLSRPVDSERSWASKMALMKKKVIKLEELLVGISLLRLEALQVPMRRQNYDVYKTLRKLDQMIYKESRHLSPETWSFANQYKSYIDVLFAGDPDISISEVAVQTKYSILRSLEADFAHMDSFLEETLRHEPRDTSNSPMAPDADELVKFKNRTEVLKTANFTVQIDWRWLDCQEYVRDLHRMSSKAHNHNIVIGVEDKPRVRQRAAQAA